MVDHRVIAAGLRPIDVEVGQLALALLPGRALDVGEAMFSGTPIAWQREVSEASNALAENEWIGAWRGGFITTCGLRNVGLPSEGHGLHGRLTFQHATDISIEATDTGKVVRATIDELGQGSDLLRLQRTITLTRDPASVRYDDVTVNMGQRPEGAPILYHINIGPPLASEGLAVRSATVRFEARAAEYESGLDRATDPFAASHGDGEVVLEHLLDPADPGLVVLQHARVPIVVTVAWDRRQLPRVHEWIQSRGRTRVLAIEPANCSLRGRAHDRERGSLPILEPGESRATGVTITITRRSLDATVVGFFG